MKQPPSTARWLAPVAVGCLFPWLLTVFLGLFVEHLSLPAQEYASRAHKLAIPFWVSWLASALACLALGFIFGKALALLTWVNGKAELVILVVAASMTFFIPVPTSGNDWLRLVLFALPNLAAGLVGVLLGSRVVGANANAA